MIFLFLKPSLALLEAKICPIKVCFKIEKFVQQSSSSSSCCSALCLCSALNISQFLSKLKVGITRLLERLERVLKKGKSSEFNPQKDEQVKSSPSLKVWSHKCSNLYPKMAQWVKKCIFYIFSKSPQRPIFSSIVPESARSDHFSNV